MDAIVSFFTKVSQILRSPLFTIGDTEVTFISVVWLIVFILLLFITTGVIRKYVVGRLLQRTRLDIGIQHAITTITTYVIILIGLIVLLQTAGIDLTTLNVLVGALGIGVGFGLQNIVNNFISGLIILLERPIKIGDRIEVGSIEGDVVKIGGRSTTVLTNDNISVIVPNSKFILENVVNWSHNERTVRFRIPVSVAYGSDIKLVEKALLEVAKDNPDVLDNPEPAVRFLEFGDSGLLFELRAWTMTLIHKKGKLISALNFAIYDKFKKHNIEIPFPQRDIHIRSGNIPQAGDT
jgi:small-conductance mechanosensitive channel